MDAGSATSGTAVIVVMGVSGSGKSTIAAMLAHRLHWIYEDGDRFHPRANIEKMHRGEPLTDANRWPWLSAIAKWIDATRARRPRRRCLLGAQARLSRYPDRQPP
jgi:gluconokinase